MLPWVCVPCTVRAGAVHRWLTAVRAGGFSLSDLVVSVIWDFSGL
jgi:hypothetical protein